MARLLSEIFESDDLKLLTEGEGREKKFKISGPFLQADTRNRNGRVYPKPLLQLQTDKYQEKIQKRRSYGELDHPPTPTVQLKYASHIITELEWRDEICFGVAEILDTPMGEIAKSILKAGAQLAVSSRGVGSLNNGIVGEDYKFLAVDIVSDPSAPSAFVEGILEGREYIIDGDTVVEQAIESMKRGIDKNGSKVALKETMKFLSAVKKRLSEK